MWYKTHVAFSSQSNGYLSLPEWHFKRSNNVNMAFSACVRQWQALRFLPVSVIMMTTANKSGYSANIPGAFMGMYTLQNCSMLFPTSSSNVALHARATLEVPKMEKESREVVGLQFCHLGFDFLQCIFVCISTAVEGFMSWDPTLGQVGSGANYLQSDGVWLPCVLCCCSGGMGNW